MSCFQTTAADTVRRQSLKGILMVRRCFRRRRRNCGFSGIVKNLHIFRFVAQNAFQTNSKFRKTTKN